MSPANEGFGSVNGAGRQIHLRLVVQHELVLIKSSANTLKVLMVTTNGKIKPGVEDVITILTFNF